MQAKWKSLSRYLHSNREAAIEALESAGATHDPRIDLVVDHPVVGVVKRYFGVFGNVLASPWDTPALDRLRRLVEHPDNERFKRKLDAGYVDYCPGSKKHAQQIDDDVDRVGVHLPWAFTAMNLDLAEKLDAVDPDNPIKFDVYYSRFVTFYGTNDGAHLAEVGRLFSMPINEGKRGTWLEPAFDTMLDPDVGLIVEANTR